MDYPFLNRLRNLQAICNSSENCPDALLFINGGDGKNNKGTHSVLKYLFFGSVGKDLFDESSNDGIDNLDDLVLLIQRSSVSVMWRYVLFRIVSVDFVKFNTLGAM